MDDTYDRDKLRTELTRLSLARTDAKKRGDRTRAVVYTRRIDELLDEWHTLTGTFADAGTVEG